jgi:hypothetical protein
MEAFIPGLTSCEFYTLPNPDVLRTRLIAAHIQLTLFLIMPLLFFVGISMSIINEPVRFLFHVVKKRKRSYLSSSPEVSF